MNPLFVSIIIPAYNESKTILKVLEQVMAQKVSGVIFEVIVVDDCSSDSTQQLLTKNSHLYNQLITHKKNGGKGAAIISGLKQAKGEYILFQDADMEYDPCEYDKLLTPVLRFEADMVIGSRLIAPQYIKVHYFWNKLGNALITLCFNILFNKTFTDIYTCYVLFKKSLVDSSELKTSGWQQQAEILSHIVKRGRAFYEVPISYHGRTVEEGKKIKAIHAIPIVWTIFKQRFF